MDQEKILKVLSEAEQRIAGHLNEIIQKHDFSYETFGKAIEEYVIAEVIAVLSEAGLIKGEDDYEKAGNKNAFPDLYIKSEPGLAIDIKSGNHYQKKKGKWVKVKNSQNDMGTLNSWQKKIDSFGTENIYYIFIEYQLTDEVQRVIKVKIRPFYKFLDLNSDEFLKYREKDGNLRPSNFDKESPIKSAEEFEKLLVPTLAYRAKRITKKRIEEIPADERNDFLENLKD